MTEWNNLDKSFSGQIYGKIVLSKFPRLLHHIDPSGYTAHAQKRDLKIQNK